MTTKRRLLLLIVFTIGFLQEIKASKRATSAAQDPVNQPQIPADISPEEKQKPIAIEGKFIVPEGDSDHLFRPSDFVKEEAIRLGSKSDDEVRSKCDIENPSQPRVQIFQDDFIHNEQDVDDEHLFDRENFEKYEVLPE